MALTSYLDTKIEVKFVNHIIIDFEILQANLIIKWFTKQKKQSKLVVISYNVKLAVLHMHTPYLPPVVMYVGIQGCVLNLCIICIFATHLTKEKTRCLYNGETNLTIHALLVSQSFCTLDIPCVA